MSPFSELETPIYDTAMMAQVLGNVIEELHGAATRRAGGQVMMTDHEAEILAFLVYDLCRRTNDLRKEFQAIFDAEASAREQELRKAA